MVVRWKIDKRDIDGIQNSKMIFLLSAESKGCNTCSCSVRVLLRVLEIYYQPLAIK